MGGHGTFLGDGWPRDILWGWVAMGWSLGMGYGMSHGDG